MRKRLRYSLYALPPTQPETAASALATYQLHLPPCGIRLGTVIEVSLIVGNAVDAGSVGCQSG